jgi:hypothetical protein
MKVKHLILSLYLISNSVGLIGCGGSAQSSEKSSGQDLPDWVTSPSESCAVGSSKIDGSISIAIDFATIKARSTYLSKQKSKIKVISKMKADHDNKQTSQVVRKNNRGSVSGLVKSKTKTFDNTVYVLVCK